MKTSIASESSQQLWGIYHMDREYARIMGDPLRTVIEARTKLEAEQQAARLGFDSPWAHPVTETEAQKAEWLPQRRARVTAPRQTVEPAGKRYVQSV